MRIWPEVLPALGIDPACLHLLALMGDKRPRKGIALVR
jgi:hypothetical protein